LIEHVDGVRDRKEARKYAGELLRERLIAHVVNKSSFTEQCYYVFGEECAQVLQLRNEDGTAKATPMMQQQYPTGALPTLPSQPPPTQKAGLTPNKQQYTNWTPHSGGDYVSMSPFLLTQQQQQALFNANNSAPPMLSAHPRADLHSQVSSNDEGSNSSDQRKKPKIPPAPQFGLGLYNPTHGHQSTMQQANGDSLVRLDEMGCVQGIGVPCEGFFVDHL